MADTRMLSEQIENSTLLSLHQHCPTQTRRELGLELIHIEDATVSIARHDSNILLNRAQGLGTRGLASLDDIARISDCYCDRGIERFFLQLYETELPFDSELLQSACGLEKARSWMKFERGAVPPPAVPGSVRVEQVTDSTASSFSRIVCNAFDLSEAAVPLVAGLVQDSRWHLFLAYIDGQPAGTGGLFVENGCGWLDWGATDPRYRRRGCQGSVMAERIRRAVQLGCKHLFTETGEDVAGDPQHSYGNILRFGFVEAISRANYVPTTRHGRRAE